MDVLARTFTVVSVERPYVSMPMMGFIFTPIFSQDKAELPYDQLSNQLLAIPLMKYERYRSEDLMHDLCPN